MLLDTQVVLWLVQDSPRLGVAARATITASPTTRVLTASLWEVAIKRRLGKITVPDNFLERIEEAGVRWLPVDAAHAWATQRVDLLHGDPFDRLLVAQARVERLTLTTADRAILGAALPGVSVLDARS